MIAILADDLTSALDGAGPFAAAGWPARVALRDPPAGLRRGEVVAVDLDSRVADPVTAERRFAVAAERLADATILFKTIDSTLRGRIGAEVRGALAGSGRARAIVAPAFPGAGRTTVEGVQHVGGTPVAETAFGHELLHPVSSSLITDHLADVAGLLEIVDACSDEELDTAVARIGIGADVLWVGSPGLAHALASAVSRGRPAPSCDELAAGRLLVVIGSLHEANGAQVDRLIDELHVEVATLRDGSAGCRDAALAAIRHSTGQTGIGCLVTPRLAAAEPGASKRLAAAVAYVVAGAIDQVDALVLTGGDTARRVLDGLGVDEIVLSGELEPGLPYGRSVVRGRSVRIATKAGGFGSADSLVNAAAGLVGRRAMA